MPKQREPIALVEADADEQHLAMWHQLIGRAVVSFGTLERLTLSWASVLANDAQLALRLHRDDMKGFAQTLLRELRKREHRLPRDVYRRAKKAIESANELIGQRNDVAHGWLQEYKGLAMLFVAKPVRAGKMVIGVRPLQWVADVITRTDAATVELRDAMNAVGQVLKLHAE